MPNSNQPFAQEGYELMEAAFGVHNVQGGGLLSYIDQAGAVGAHYESRRAGWPDQPLVSVAMNGVEFHLPVFVGDVVSFWTRLARAGIPSRKVSSRRACAM